MLRVASHLWFSTFPHTLRVTFPPFEFLTLSFISRGSEDERPLPFLHWRWIGCTQILPQIFAKPKKERVNLLRQQTIYHSATKFFTRRVAIFIPIEIRIVDNLCMVRLFVIWRDLSYYRLGCPQTSWNQSLLASTSCHQTWIQLVGIQNVVDSNLWGDTRRSLLWYFSSNGGPGKGSISVSPQWDPNRFRGARCFLLTSGSAILAADDCVERVRRVVMARETRAGTASTSSQNENLREPIRTGRVKIMFSEHGKVGDGSSS